MTRNISIRPWVGVGLLLCAAVAWSENSVEAKWYKGNLHSHTCWSDGRAFPEQAITWYKDRGYHFLSLTDHRVVQTDPQRWVPISDRIAARYEELTEQYGDDYLSVRGEDDMKEIRLPTFAEFAPKFNEPERFLLIPGLELSNGAENRTLHMNIVNTEQTLQFRNKATIAETISLISANTLAASGAAGRSMMLMQNHPIWPYFEVNPQDLIDVPTLLFLEINNGDLTHSAPDGLWRNEHFWDVVNAHRFEVGYPPLYGVGTDDRHTYGEPFGPVPCSWVDAETLSIDAILSALYQGKFYASTGVQLETIDFDSKTKELSVKVRPEAGKKYRIDFLGTKKGFNHETRTVRIEAGTYDEKQPARDIVVFSDEIGVVFASVEGTEASYRLTDEDLYVRARITELGSEPEKWTQAQIRAGNNNAIIRAWTQPVAQ